MKIFCNSCKQETNHKASGQYTKSLPKTEDGNSQKIDYEILECLGCETIAFRELYIIYNSNNEEIGIYPKLFPQRDINILLIKNYPTTPAKIYNIYRTTVDAYNTGMPILCAAGLRAIIEGICSEKGINDGEVSKTKLDGTIERRRVTNLEGKIAGLYEHEHLTKKHSEVLNEHRFLGNDALHELDEPSLEELKIAIEIIEHTIENIYEIEEKANSLRTAKATRRTP